ncbi:hypothetical protein P9112_000475 [Eukaryota sp. TZLM1-RC]
MIDTPPETSKRSRLIVSIVSLVIALLLIFTVVYYLAPIQHAAFVVTPPAFDFPIYTNLNSHTLFFYKSDDDLQYEVLYDGDKVYEISNGRCLVSSPLRADKAKFDEFLVSVSIPYGAQRVRRKNYPKNGKKCTQYVATALIKDTEVLSYWCVRRKFVVEFDAGALLKSSFSSHSKMSSRDERFDHSQLCDVYEEVESVSFAGL